MKKKALFVIIILSLIFIVPFIFAAQDKIDNAYSCLQQKIADKTCIQLSTQEKIFSSLALGKCNSELRAEATNEMCWPDSGCNLKTTAQATLALQSSSGKDWILSKKAAPSDLTWYLQIEPDSASTCTISYGGNDYAVQIRDDKKIDSNAGACLSLSSSKYWLEVSKNCYEKEFEISCDQDFLTDLLFKSSGSPTIHVSEETSSATAGGTTTAQVNSFCFANSGNCDYEGSLWATLALNSLGEDVSSYIPYLITMADENQQYLPEIFLYALTGYEDFRYDILSKQTSNDYWSFSGDKYYSTALALYPFGYEDFNEKQKAMQWLIDNQESDGCWNSGNIFDTAFILHSVWPRQVSTNTSNTEPSCSGVGYCMSSADCSDAEGNVLSDYSCSSYLYVCCDSQAVQKTCEEAGGKLCTGGKECSGNTLEASDTFYCCFDECVEPTPISEFTCTSNNGVCESYECGQGYISSDYTCDYGDICCVKESNPGPKPLFWILLVLIILVILAIVFREKLKSFWFRIKSKFRKSPPPRRGIRPGFPSVPSNRLRRRIRPRRIMPRRIMPIEHMPMPKPAPRRPKQTSSELDDVLKKLKEMGK